MVAFLYGRSLNDGSYHRRDKTKTEMGVNVKVLALAALVDVSDFHRSRDWSVLVTCEHHPIPHAPFCCTFLTLLVEKISLTISFSRFWPFQSTYYRNLRITEMKETVPSSYIFLHYVPWHKEFFLFLTRVKHSSDRLTRLHFMWVFIDYLSINQHYALNEKS